MNRRTITGKTLKFATLATAFFVFWIYLGSIINFHQHHIFGRTLMPQGVLAKREEKQISADLPVISFSLDAFESQQQVLLPEPLEFRIDTGVVTLQSILSDGECLSGHGLRAPPAA
jgi:hypothetical protein